MSRKILVACAGAGQVSHEFVTPQHVVQLFQRCRAGEKANAARTGRIQYASRRAGPQQARHGRIRISDDLHPRRAFRLGPLRLPLPAQRAPASCLSLYFAVFVFQTLTAKSLPIR
jgi:hypothetical protein